MTSNEKLTAKEKNEKVLAEIAESLKKLEKEIGAYNGKSGIILPKW